MCREIETSIREKLLKGEVKELEEGEEGKKDEEEDKTESD